MLLPHWSIDRLRRKQPAYRHKPIALIESTATRQMVIGASEEAADHAIRAGMTLAEARALCPDLTPAPYEPDRDARALEALGKWMMRFSPIVESRGGRPCHLFIDVTGCERLYGTLQTLIARVANALHSLHLTTRLAIAPTPGAAWAIAFAGQNHSIIASDQLPQILAPLSARALRIDEELAQSLRHLGLETIGQLLKLPRDLLPARFGPQLLLRLDQLLDRAPEPLISLLHEEPIHAGMDFEGVIESLETIWAVFQDLLRLIILQLRKRGVGARRLDARFIRPHAQPLEKTILLSRPSRDANNLFNLLRCAIEEVQLNGLKIQGKGRKKRMISALSTQHSSLPEFSPDGFIGLHLSVPLFEEITDDQIALMNQDHHAGEIELTHLIERLQVRLGPEAITCPQLVESYIPEHAWTGNNTTSESPKEKTKKPKKKVEEEKFSAPISRPLQLLPMPVELRVIVSPSNDCEGRPIAFNHKGNLHHVSHASGPERIAGQWWDAHNKTRDYFDVEDPEGNRFWMFRVTQTGKWYLHGMFE